MFMLLTPASLNRAGRLHADCATYHQLNSLLPGRVCTAAATVTTSYLRDFDVTWARTGRFESGSYRFQRLLKRRDNVRGALPFR